MPKITITLGRSNLGPLATEDDFDAWRSFVENEIMEALDLSPYRVVVEQHPWSNPTNQPHEDEITGGSDEQHAAIKRWLDCEGWDRFCAEGNVQ